MSLRRNVAVSLRRAMCVALDFIDDSFRSYLFRSGGLPTIVYCVVLALAFCTALSTT